MSKYLRKGIRKICSGCYVFNHGTGSCTVERNACGEWEVREECTGELFATSVTKAKAVNWIIDNKGYN